MNRKFNDKFELFIRNPNVSNGSKELAHFYKETLEHTSRKFVNLISGNEMKKSTTAVENAVAIRDAIAPFLDEDDHSDPVERDIQGQYEREDERALEVSDSPNNPITLEDVSISGVLTACLMNAYYVFDSWTALAEELDVSSLTLANWRNNKGKPHKSKLKKFVELYNKKVAE